MAGGDGARLWLWSIDPDLWNRWDDCWDFRILCSRDSKCGSDPARLPCPAHHRNGETYILPSPKRKSSCRFKTIRERLNAFIKRSLNNKYDNAKDKKTTHLSECVVLVVIFEVTLLNLPSTLWGGPPLRRSPGPCVHRAQVRSVLFRA